MRSDFHLGGGKHIHAVNLRFDKMADVSQGYIQDEETFEEIPDLKTEKVLTRDVLITPTTMTVCSAREELKFHVSPVGHGSLFLLAPDGRVSKFSRAWAKVKTQDGRSGVGWFELNDALSEYPEGTCL